VSIGSCAPPLEETVITADLEDDEAVEVPKLQIKLQHPE